MTEQKLQKEKLAKTLATMLDYLGLPSVVKPEEQDGRLILKTISEESGRIIGKKGLSLQALELLINRIAFKDSNTEDQKWISINVDGYASSKKKYINSKKHFVNRKERRGKKIHNNPSEIEKLKQQALDASKEVKRWGEPVTLPPMNSHDRRIIHMTLKDDPEVETESRPISDSEKLKTITISLKKK